MTSLRDKPNGLDRLAEELGRRQQDPHQVHAPLFLVVYGVHRFRDLRKPEDDYSFGRRGEEKVVTPAERFVELVGTSQEALTPVVRERFTGLGAA